jgi:hypothetical protein
MLITPFFKGTHGTAKNISIKLQEMFYNGWESTDVLPGTFIFF